VNRQLLGGVVLIVCGAALLGLAGTSDIRFSLKDLTAVTGRVIEADSYKPGRHSGYELRVTLATADGRVRLQQSEVGGYAHRLAAGQEIRAWLDPATRRDGSPPTYTVWQIERGREVVMPVMAVGDRLQEDMLWEYLMGGFLLICGLYLAARNWPQHPPEEGAAKQEVRP
jgi:hypothetical protein